jgi:hypothetical protein
MKTSNLLLTVAFALILAGTVLVIIKVKHLMIGEPIELSGTTTEKVQDISTFKSLDVQGALDIQIVKSDINKLTLEADSSILKLVTVNQTGDKLIIKTKSIWKKNTAIKGTLQITGFDIKNMDVSAGARVSSDDTLAATNMVINLSAGAQVNLFIICDYLECNSSAGAGVDLSGHVKEFKTTASAGAQVRAEQLIAENAVTEASAGGHIQVNVTKSLDVSCSAGGSVKYSGQPELKNININSGGNLSKAD